MTLPTRDPADVRRFIGELRADANFWRVRAFWRWRLGMMAAVVFALVSIALATAGYNWPAWWAMVASIINSHFGGWTWRRALKEADWSDETARVWAETLTGEEGE